MGDLGMFGISAVNSRPAQELGVPVGFGYLSAGRTTGGKSIVRCAAADDQPQTRRPLSMTSASL
jgi:hypothetical protein